MTKKKFYETTEFKAERNAWYARLREEGFEDIEVMNKQGDISPAYLSGPLSSSVTIENNPELDDEDRFPAGIGPFTITNRMVKHDQATRYALAACRARFDWEECTAWAMYADGYNISETAQTLERSREKTRKLLAPLMKLLVN